MEKALTPEQSIAAARLVESGVSLETARQMLGLDCSRQTVWRAVRAVTTAEERIARARRTGSVEGLDIGEILALDEPEPPDHPVPQPEKEAEDGTTPLEF